MKHFRLTVLKFFALLFFLPGLVGLVANASLATHYFDSLPRMPDPDSMRTVPYPLNGDVVYLTAEEDQQLYALRHYGALALGIGIGFGLLYFGGVANHLEQSHAHPEEEDD